MKPDQLASFKALFLFLFLAFDNLSYGTTYTWIPINGTGNAPAINDSGAIAGWSGGIGMNIAFGDAYSFSNGLFTNIGRPDGANAAFSTAINNNGWIVGYGFPGPTQAPPTSGFLYHDGNMEVIFSSNTGASAEDINDSGTVVGWTSSAGVETALIYSNGTTTQIPGLIRGLQISNEGAILGLSKDNEENLHLNILSNGQLQDLGISFPLTYQTEGGPLFTKWEFHMNNLGQIVGNYTNGTPFLYSDGQSKSFPTAPEGGIFYPSGINDLGQVVGNIISNGSSYGALYENDTYTPLAALLSDGPSTNKPYLAQAINNSGFITASSFNTSYPSPFLMMPVPEPGISAFLMFGGSLFLFLRGRHRFMRRSLDR